MFYSILISILFLSQILRLSVTANDNNTAISAMIECLGELASQYELSDDQQGVDVFISRIDDQSLDFVNKDVTLWYCLQNRTEWNFGLAPMTQESDRLFEEHYSYDTDSDDEPGVIRAGVNFSLNGHSTNNCGGTKLWTWNVDNSKKCHKPTKKVLSTKVYNNTNKQLTAKIWPHHNCERTGIYIPCVHKVATEGVAKVVYK